jgi:hypothetical protein
MTGPHYSYTDGNLEKENVVMCMKPKIDKTKFGSITVAGTAFDHDILIRLDGQVKKRKKKLSKAIYGTSHTISLAEAEHIYEQGAERLIIGTGQYDNVRLSAEAKEFFIRKNCQVDLQSTPQALETWNQAEGAVIGLFHVTC